MIEKILRQKSTVVTYIVFAFAFGIVILNIIPILFPALLVTSIVSSESDIDSFELGAWAIPFFSINLTILVFGLLYYRQLMPNVINKFFKFVLNFEVSRKMTIIVFSVIVGIYISFTVGELNESEGSVWKDWAILEKIITDFPYGGEDKPALRILYINNFLLYSSQEIFQNVKIIPFIGSVSLLFLTYFLTVQISQKRFAGLVATVILLQSHTFLRYDTTATFSNFWTVFYLASLYLIYKKWALSPLAFLSSVFSKALSMAFLPMTLFFILRSRIPKKTKIGLTILYVIIIVVLVGGFILAESLGYTKSFTSFEYIDFVSGFTVLAFQLRIDGLILMFLLPLIFGLFLTSRKGNQAADSVLVMIAGILLSVPALAGFTEFNIQPYRWIPLIAFFAIGVGTLFSRLSPNRSEN